MPGVALAALWAVTSGQTFLDYQRQAAQVELTQKAGQPSNIVYYDLQAERELSAQALARGGGDTAALRAQRTRTDKAVATFESLSGATIAAAPADERASVAKEREALAQLPSQRTLVDQGVAEDQTSVYRYYTNLITVDLQLLTSLGHVDNGTVTTASQPLVDMFWAKEMISRSDALLARGWPKRGLSPDSVRQLRDSLSQESFEYDVKVLPYLPGGERDDWDALMESPAWQDKSAVEQNVLAPAAIGSDGLVPLTADGQSWQRSMDTLTPVIERLMEQRTAGVVATGKDTVRSLLWKMVLTSAIGLAAVVAVAVTSWRLARSLRRRIGSLQERAEELERVLPDVVERLAQGELIDVDAEAGSIEAEAGVRGGDELARLGRALNLARASALGAAVRQAEQHRGFERLLQRIARRTQRLIGQQLKKLDELERRYDDPEVLEGLFDLDHLTARLRRYEENLVIMSGGSPHRRWRKPVPLLDVLRSAQGEVRDYRRVTLDPESGAWLSERGVGPVGHVLAELIENALAFSRPPTPVDVRAARVGRGIAIEVEDRGLGMDEAQLAEANALMTAPPRMDVLANGEDVRLGLRVVARLADQYGLRVEFRPSAFGGTRVVLFVPETLTAAAPPRAVAAGAPLPDHDPSDPLPPEVGDLPQRIAGRALAGATAEPGYVPSTPYAVAPRGPEAGAGPAGHGRHAGPSRAATTTGGPAEGPGARFRDPAGPAPDPGSQETGSRESHERPQPGHLSAAHRAPGRPAPTSAPPRPAGAVPGPFGMTPDDAPLPRRVRQASLVDELRGDPAAPVAAPRRPSWDENPLLRPVPRRAGAAIGAFQRQSRAARAHDGTTGPGPVTGAGDPRGTTPAPPEPAAPPFPPRDNTGEERP
ncbi:nitrate- and nitrite sensing domain-containing protein [Streptomyces sp. NBC_01497]|uniref:nitrate- and nitrite sensing domain-containing protein n=1 Tax=Streptomyces sp. NBC_01497 TaxID=2903885 RepID=UPI002E3204C4|nr:nitrate- and nitrite sensing domain-containing protein [Streptomyces sp. NBC_01497]